MDRYKNLVVNFHNATYAFCRQEIITLISQFSIPKKAWNINLMFFPSSCFIQWPGWSFKSYSGNLLLLDRVFTVNVTMFRFYKPKPLYEYLFISLFYIVAYFLLYISSSLYNQCYFLLKLVYWLFCKKTNKGLFKVSSSSYFF